MCPARRPVVATAGLPATVPARAVAPAVWAGARAVEPARALVAPAVWSGARATGSGRADARQPGRTLGPGRFFPVVFGSRPASDAATTATSTAAAATAVALPPCPVGGFRPAPPKRGRGPAVLGVTRPIPGAVSTHKIATAASSRAAVTPVVAPAPGRIAFMAGGWLAPAAEPAAGSTARPAGAVRPVRRIAAAGAARPPPD